MIWRSNCGIRNDLVEHILYRILDVHAACFTPVVVLGSGVGSIAPRVSSDGEIALNGVSKPAHIMSNTVGIDPMDFMGKLKAKGHLAVRIIINSEVVLAFAPNVAVAIYPNVRWWTNTISLE